MAGLPRARLGLWKAQSTLAGIFANDCGRLESWLSQCFCAAFAGRYPRLYLQDHHSHFVQPNADDQFHWINGLTAKVYDVSSRMFGGEAKGILPGVESVC
jgi:hypothetical protein